MEVKPTGKKNLFPIPQILLYIFPAPRYNKHRKDTPTMEEP